MSTKTISQLLDKVLSHFPDAKLIGKDQYETPCPAHNDLDPSLHIKVLAGKVLLNCKAGCDIKAVLKAAGLTMADLFLEERGNGHKPGAKEYGEIVATYTYHNAQRKPIFEVVRYANPKGFAQRRPDGSWGLKGVKPELYHRPDIDTAKRTGDLIYLPEGEKDVDNLWGLGLVATTPPMGANKPIKQQYLDALAGGHIRVIGDNDPEGQKHTLMWCRALYPIAASLKLLTVPREVKDVSEWFESGATAEDLEKLESNTPEWVPPVDLEPASDDPHKYNLTDLGNAERFAREWGDKVRYCYARKRWLVWGGKVWKWDDGALVGQMAAITARHINKEAAEEPNKEHREALLAHAKSTERKEKIKAMLELAQFQNGIPIETSELDRDHYLFNCKNGTIALRTGQLYPHRAADMITLMAPVIHDPDATSIVWAKFIADITLGNTDLPGYLQRCMGYSLTGDQKEQVCFFPWGTGSNGKSTFLTACREVMGPYAMQGNTDLFLQAGNFSPTGHQEDMANLEGKRMVTAIELESGKRLSVSKVKQMTGGEKLRASHKYEREREFESTHKIWLGGNHKPVITDTTLSIWRRVKLIPFTVVIPEEKRDKDMPTKLRGEYSAVLAWMVKGCIEWQRIGLAEPVTVTEATKQYREQQDILGEWIATNCVEKSTATAVFKLAFADYHKWCNENEEKHPMGRNTFRDRLHDRGLEVKEGHARERTIYGLGLLTGHQEKMETQT